MKHCKKELMLFTAATFVFAGAFFTPAQAALSPAQVRAAARAELLSPLREVPIPEPPNLTAFLKPGLAARQAAIQLGKALFWDMQVGSDGQACATCHFHAGADSRVKNQLSPGLKNVDPALQEVFNPTGSGAAGGPNYTLTELDFPFHVIQFNDPNLPEKNFLNRTVLFDTDDVVSSQGVFNADFTGTIPGKPADLSDRFADAIFNVGGINTRRVEPRNTPTMINAVFNHSNFWDGRAHNVFNGASPIGPLDETAQVWVRRGRGLVAEAVALPNSSLASQAVGPPLSDLEMSFFDRTFPEIGKKLFSLTPLNLQVVSRDDSVLGNLSRATRNGRGANRTGLNTRYQTLIQKAFRPEFWNYTRKIDGFTQMEKNFSLFFGLAVQMYEATLVSDRTPFDLFMEGDDTALTQEQLQGLLTFINVGNPLGQLGNPLFTGISQGACIPCHAGAEFTSASAAVIALGPIELDFVPRLVDGLLAPTDPLELTFQDEGFYNIGVRPTSEDLGRGATINDLPLSFTKQGLAGLNFPFTTLPTETPEFPGAALPVNNRSSIDGSFKVPGLRNAELTGPYFHNGGMATLLQVVEFYDRHGDFADVNIANLDGPLSAVQLVEGDEELLVEFLLSLTDDRVRNEKAPFDHPQLFVPDGHPGDQSFVAACLALQACDNLREIPVVGAMGRPVAGLPPLGTFLGVEHLEEP